MAIDFCQDIDGKALLTIEVISLTIDVLGKTIDVLDLTNEVLS
jgi:hypothetical protein